MFRYTFKLYNFVSQVFKFKFNSKLIEALSTTSSLMDNVSVPKLAAIQMSATEDKSSNLEKMESLVKQAAESGCNIVTLPECFNSPYGTKYFEKYAESIPGTSTNLLQSLAKFHKIYIVGGSIPELDGDKIYNTATVFNPQGELLLKFRKIHLFDIDIPGKITIKESNVLSAGSKICCFDTEWFKVGLAICYDIRFPELATIMRQEGCKLLLYPGCFNMTTGAAHWELLIRARALDNQCYVGAIAQARRDDSDYVSWAHSTICNPWGEVIAKAGVAEDIIYADIDSKYADRVRTEIPISFQKRDDLYTIKKL